MNNDNDHNNNNNNTVRKILFGNNNNSSNPLSTTSNKKKLLNRYVIEQNLIFAGFLVFDCPLKSDSRSIILEMKHSHHNVVMITGDAVLTAAEVARQVGILR